MSGDRHHFIQASLLGGFGRTPAGKRQRDADIEQRRTGTATTETTTPDKVGWADKLYRLQDPGPGVDPDEVDKLWDPVERITAPRWSAWRTVPRTSPTSTG